VRRGKLIQEWRVRRGLNAPELARQLTAQGGPRVSRQQIEQLEAGEVDRPRYLPELARAMGYLSVDQLLRCEPPPEQADRPLSPDALALARSLDRIESDELRRVAYATCEATISTLMLQSSAQRVGGGLGLQTRTLHGGAQDGQSGQDHSAPRTTYGHATGRGHPVR